MVALYDAPSAKICCDAGIDALLVGDSMGNVVLGYDDTVAVTVDDIRVHTGAVARGAKSSSKPDTPVVADLPFGSYATPELAVHNGAILMRAGAHALKLEGAGEMALSAVRVLAQMGAPVVGHIGYTPQSSLRFEGVVQGKTAAAARELLAQAKRLQDAGCCAIVLEAVAAEAAARITENIEICAIGIGAGAACNGQVLVWHDLVGLLEGAPFRFVKRFANAREVLQNAAREYSQQVKSGAFPTAEHAWKMVDGEIEKLRDGETQK